MKTILRTVIAGALALGMAISPLAAQVRGGSAGGSGGGGTSDATHAEQLNQLTQETKIGNGIGAPADSACATDNGSCDLIQQWKLALARFSSIITQLTTLNTTATASVPCRSASTSPTAVSDGAVNAAMCDLVGKLVTVPFQFQEFWTGGGTSSTDTSAHTMLAAQGSGVKIYITHIHCWREDAGTTQIHATLNDSLTTLFGIPAGGEFISDFSVPLEVAANTAATFTMSSGVTTAYCYFRGYKGR